MSKRKIILDCDPGYDDAIAIALAGKADNIEVLGITTVSGNTKLENTSKNALNLVNYLGLNIPVYIGQDRALIKPVHQPGKVHGESGLDGVNLSQSPSDFQKQKAVEYIIETCLKYPKDITIVATGPLTNIAMAIRLEPKIVDCIQEIISMGGSMGKGNVTPAAEFNIYDDPEAAYIVYSSGISIKMIGLDVTNKVMLLPEIVERMKKINGKGADVFCKCAVNYNNNINKLFGRPCGALHDPVTICCLINPDIVTFQKMFVTVDISGLQSYGRTNCDHRLNLHSPNTDVGVDINVEEFWNIVENVLAKY